MQIFGFKLDKSYVYLGTGTVGCFGICYAFYKIIKRQKNSKNEEIDIGGVVEDLRLPILLEHDFGDYRSICESVDPDASAYLKELPQNFFHFNNNLDEYSAGLYTKRFSHYRQALVLGSGSGRLVFQLGKTFDQVTGIDNYFTRIVTCFKFQNGSRLKYVFPFEGSYRTITKEPNYLVLKKPKNSESILNEKESKIEFINADLCSLPPNIGQHQIVFLTDILNELVDPEALLTNIHRYVESNGLLFICTDYNWKRSTNEKVGFGVSKIVTSFDFLLFILRDFFDLVDEKNIADIVGESLRTCTCRYLHISVWERNSRPILP